MLFLKKLDAIILSLLLLTGSVSVALAFEVVNQQSSGQNSSNVSYLSGDFISLTDRVLTTSVGTYKLTDAIALVDLSNLQNRDFSESDKRPKVTMTFNNKQLIKVLIYD